MKPVTDATETCMQLDQKQLLKATWYETRNSLRGADVLCVLRRLESPVPTSSVAAQRAPGTAPTAVRQFAPGTVPGGAAGAKARDSTGAACQHSVTLLPACLPVAGPPAILSFALLTALSPSTCLPASATGATRRQCTSSPRSFSRTPVRRTSTRALQRHWCAAPSSSSLNGSAGPLAAEQLSPQQTKCTAHHGGSCAQDAVQHNGGGTSRARHHNQRCCRITAAAAAVPTLTDSQAARLAFCRVLPCRSTTCCSSARRPQWSWLTGLRMLGEFAAACKLLQGCAGGQQA